MPYIYDQGNFIEDKWATVSIKNKGLQYGLGFIEGIRAFWNREENQLYLFRMEDHYIRFHQSGNILHMPIPLSVDALNQITIELMKINKVMSDVYIRPICFKGEQTITPTLLEPINRVAIFQETLTYVPKPSIKVSVSSWRRNGNDMIPPQAKSTAGYLNSALARLEANQNGFDEAIFLTTNGFVCEGSSENIFLVKEHQLMTPPVSDGILPGITRDTVMTLAKNELGMEVIERSVSRSELYRADELFFTGTAIGIKPIVEVDHRPVGQGKSGPITEKIQQLYELMVRGKLPNYKHYCTAVY
ncbi:branched-chain amino acid transaminase [Bacillus sp. FJAT-47783]|uniref:branched-chain amino acid transaminase n=1 Tax=Bacillus sp. FJAT-47783 TaxID=2922712 RepID=UPI001FAB84BC|nr:branched-chain amino acid transaminase [Bacillus sp. FJAT-47783]